MRTGKRALALLLCMALLMSFLPAIGVHAEEMVIWEDDFESYEADASIEPATDTVDKWSEATVATTSTISVYKENAKNNVARMLSTATAASGPRIGKKLYLKGVKDLKISFRVRTEGGATVTFGLVDGNKVSSAAIAGASSEWTEYEVNVDIAGGTYEIYKNGRSHEEGKLAAPLTTGITVRFGGSVRNGGCVYYDDIKITTTTAIDLARLSNPKNADPLAPPSDIEGYQAAMAVKRITSSSDTVIFEDNFDSLASNDLIPASPDTAGAWSIRSASATATVTAMELDGTKVLRISNSASTASGPRLIKNIYPAGMDKFTVSFMVRTEGTAQVSFTVTNGIDTAFGLGKEHKKWTAYEYVCDIKNKTYVCYKDGVKDSEGPLGGELDGEISIRFSGSTRNSTAVYYDNIKITTPNKVDLERVQTGSAGPALTVAQYVDKAAKGYAGELPPASSMPADAFQLFSFENNNGISTINTGTDATWTSIETKDTIKAAPVKGNEVLLAVNPRVSKRRSALTKKLGMGSDASDLTIETNLFFIGAGATSLSMDSTTGQGTLFATQEISSSQAGIVSGWNTVRYDIDFKQEKYSIYLNGKAIASGLPFTNKADNYAEVNLKVMLINEDADAIVLLDNVSMYTKTPVRYTTMMYGSEGVNWDLVKGTPITEASFVSNLRAHPRVLVNDWDVMREKIATNKQCANWYQNLKDEADFLLTAPNIPYTFENGRNWLTGGRNVRYRLETLGFVYGITGERKYIDRALEEMRFAATHPDWSNTAPIISSECMLGYAMAYDWMYYGLTDDEKAEIRQIICDKALWQFVHSYAGRINVEIASGVSNRTMVSNGCGLLTAIAIADEMPEVANYIYQNAIKYAKPPFEEFSEDGGFPEGAMYWDYASRFAVLMMSALQSAPVEGYTLEPDAQWFFDQKSMKNTPKFNIYLNSVDKSFNFGDASEGLQYSPAHYWFAKYCDEPFYQWYQDDLLEKHQERYADTIDEIQAIIWYNTDMDMSNIDDVSLDAVFNTEGSAVATMRSSFADKRALYVGIQGGDNMTGHMGYSLGNFVLDALGQRFINTIGAGNYSAQFATESYYAKRTEGQNTILFNPDASAGQEKSATATFTAFASDDDEAFAVLDMSKTHKSVSEAQRGMHMTRGRKSVIIQDEFKMNEPSEVYWFAQTKAAITLAEDKMSAVLRMGGEQMLVVLKKAPAGATLSVMQAKPLPTSPTAGDEAYKTYYKLAVHATDVTEGTISVEFIPIAQGESPSTAKQTAFAPISQWALNPATETTAAEAFTNSVALKLGSPVAFANGHKTYVDTNNYAVMPFTENGRTLVPVRFISEKIGGVVSWDEATQKVTVQHGRNEIILHIGQNEMLVNGEAKVLDVPAQTVNGRTVIPLRAMVEAIGKNVFWDDRGLILINNDAQNPTETEIVKMLALLDTRVFIGGNEFTAFTPDATAYVAKPQGDNVVTVLSGGEAVPVAFDGAASTFSLAGKTYSVRIEEDRYANLIGTDSDDVTSLIGINIRTIKTSQTQTVNYIPVAGAEMSTGHDKYISSGTIDNVINKEMINRWSGQGLGEYIIYDLGSVQNVHSFGLATYNGDTRSFLFALQVSEDGTNWTEILNTKTSGTTTLFDIFKLGDVQARYVKVIGYGDSNGGTYNSWTEVRFWANAAQEQADKAVWENGLDDIKTYKVGDVLKIDVTATNVKGGIMDSSGATYTTDREGIISIAPDGTINVIGDGKVRITVTLNNGFRDVTSFTELVCEN